MTAEAFRTERLVARDWREDEADRHFDLYRRWEVARWLGARPRVPADREESLERIRGWRELNRRDPRGGVWACERATDGVVVGTLLVVELPEGGGELEIGWHLHPDSWGQGYATEAGQAALARTFEHGVAQVLAVVRPDNTASLGVCHRLGMTALGRTDRYYGTELELFRRTRDPR